MALNEKDFEPIHDEKIAAKYLQFSSEQHQELECFIKETDFRFEATLADFDPSKFELKVALSTEQISGETVRLEHNKTFERKIILSFQTQGGLFLLATALQLARPKELILQAKLPFYKMQRRHALRVKPGSDIPCTIFLPLPWEDVAVIPYDISTSGFSVLVSEKIADHFNRGDILKALSLQFLQQKNTVQAKVSHKVRLPNDKLDRWKIGFNFQGLNKQLEQEIAREAHRFNQRIWARRL